MSRLNQSCGRPCCGHYDWEQNLVDAEDAQTLPESTDELDLPENMEEAFSPVIPSRPCRRPVRKPKRNLGGKVVRNRKGKRSAARRPVKKVCRTVKKGIKRKVRRAGGNISRPVNESFNSLPVSRPCHKKWRRGRLGAGIRPNMQICKKRGL